MATATEQRLIDFIRQEKERAQFTVRQHYDPEWDEAIEAYMNHRTTDMPPGAEWVDDRQIAEAFRTVETLTPQHVLGTYQNERWFSVDAPTVAGETYQKMVHALLTVAHKNADYMMRSIPEIRMGIILGHSIQKTYWAVEIGQRPVRSNIIAQNAFGEPIQQEILTEEEMMIHNGPWVEWPDLKTIWKSIETDNMGRHWWYLQSKDTTIDMLEMENEDFKAQGGLYNSAALKKLKEFKSVPSTPRHSGTYDSMYGSGHGAGDPFDVSTIEEMISGISRSAKRGEGGVVKWEFWGFVPPRVKKYDDTQWRLIEIGNGEHLLRDVAAPTWDHRPPFDDIYSYQVGKEPYGRGMLRWIYPEIEQMSVIRNLRLAGVMAELFPQWIANADAQFESEELFRMPGGIWWVHPNNQSLRDIIEPVQRQPILPNAYNETALLEDHLLKTSGATEPFQGAFAPGGSHRTLGEFQGTVSLGASRHRLQIVGHDLQGKMPFLSRAFREYQLNQPDIIVQLADEHNVRGQVPFELLQENVDIKVDSGAFGQLDAQKLTNLVNLLGAFGQNPQFAQAIKTNELIRDAFFYAGFPRAGRYVRTDDEMAELAAQQQQQALLEAALGGSGAGSLESNSRVA